MAKRPKPPKKRPTLPKKLSVALGERKKLARDYQRQRAGSVKRSKIVEKIKKLDAYIGPRRRAIADTERDAFTARDRVKELRKYVRGYESDDGFDMRYPKTLTRKQLQRVERDWRKLVPVLARPHVKARPRRAHEKGDIKALAEFAGLNVRSLPKRLKAVPVVAFAKTRVTIDDAGEVKKRRGAIAERHYLFSAAEKRAMKRSGRVDEAVRSLLARMPRGRYFAVTGEAEAFQRTLEHDGPESADDDDNLLMRQVNRWIAEYSSRTQRGHSVEIWLRGFRWIGTTANDDAGKRERGRIIKARSKRERERRERRDELAKRARSRAAHIVPK